MSKYYLLIILFILHSMWAYAGADAYHIPPDFSIYNVQYKVQLNDGKWADKIPINMHVTPYILISKEGSISGFAGCNKFVGAIDLNTKTHKFKVDSLVSTKRACKNSTFQALEVEFLKSLNKAVRYDILVDQLTLKDNNGYPILIFSGIKLPNK
ncbi:META domain-containing protein [Candidatus Hepatincola sp. Pdp]